MADQLKVRLVTPDRILVDQTVEAVEVPGKNGYFEVLYGAAPLLSEIGAGEVRLHGGEEIDTGAAQEQLQHGQKLWNEAGEDPEKYAHANEVMAEAEAKLESAGAGKH
jgi:F-type H+-transporting ATPase subunit epsilon